MHNRKPYKIIDRKREVKKGVMAETLDELVKIEVKFMGSPIHVPM